jgi:GntR family transcriptional regulator
MIEFYLDTRSGVAPYLQLVQQVRRAQKLGLLREGDQLPTVKEVVAKVAINPNTVQLEHEGLATARPGVGTFITKSLSEALLNAHEPLRHSLQGWLADARTAGLDDESIEALFRECFRSTSLAGVA